ncbi:hypothetical protein CIG75_02305 [Tumebacillus algifaecis]|uniref:Uncharacterized protein n=1 Tax=Tumebacillus algifaecis TaxID=1214604 RepID=A0A223CXU5_9BACL|nr:hypothetical protein [Tumebacillus algifaecis]ASS73923.1 hypothetical protein CIG75_02305 [Tumebacillus algifaecis]
MTKIWNRVCIIAIFILGLFLVGTLGVNTNFSAYIEGPGPMSSKKVSYEPGPGPMSIEYVAYIEGEAR